MILTSYASPVGRLSPVDTDRLLSMSFKNGTMTEGSLETKTMPSDWRSGPFDDKKYMVRLVATYNDFGQVSRRK